MEDLEKLSSVSTKAAKTFETIREPLYSRRPSSLGFPSEVAQSAYYPGDIPITRQEVESVSVILEKEGVYPENTRIQKTSENGQIIYRVLQASTETGPSGEHHRIKIPGSSEDIIVTTGDHAKELTPICECLEKAREYTANSQQKAVMDQ